jgi:hypothetical protein
MVFNATFNNIKLTWSGYLEKMPHKKNTHKNWPQSYTQYTALVSVIKQLSWYEKWSLIFMCNYVALYSRNCYHLYKSSINLRLLICFPWNGLHIASPVILWEIHSCKISQWQYIVLMSEKYIFSYLKFFFFWYKKFKVVPIKTLLYVVYIL